VFWIFSAIRCSSLCAAITNETRGVIAAFFTGRSLRIVSASNAHG
jgi:hypothetical protein